MFGVYAAVRKHIYYHSRQNKIIENDLLVIYSYKNLQVYTINKRSIKYYLFLERNFNKIEKKGYKIKATTICSFSSNLPKTCDQTQRNTKDKESVDKPAIHPK